MWRLCFLCFLTVLCLSICCFFFFNDTATTEIYTLSLHDALPIYASGFEVGSDYTERSGFDPVGRDGISLSQAWETGKIGRAHV